MKAGLDSLAAKEAIASYRELISAWITCEDTTFRNKGQTYLNGKDELEKKDTGACGVCKCGDWACVSISKDALPESRSVQEHGY